MKKSNLLRIMILILIIMIIFIIILGYLNKNKDINEDEKIQNYEEISIKDRYECNEIQYVSMSIDDLILIYFDDYKTYMLENPEQAYNLLDKEYREKRFVNIDGYKAYIENNKEMISNNSLESYKISVDDEKSKYICLDQYGNYYIFTENAIMDYTVILDTYTVDLPEFTEKYSSSTEQQKVALNIDKFMQAINAKDYKYAYGCLADSFKNNYFKTQEEFENYAKENFYASNTVEYNEFDTQGDVYTYSVILTDKETGEQKTKTFIMQLGEGTEFKMSFDR